MKNTVYYMLGIFLFLGFKLGFKYASQADLDFLIKPTNTLVSILTGSSATYIEGNGYYHEHLNILIDKSCSGFNFWILLFLMLMFLSLKHTNSHLQKIGVIPAAILFAFIVTILVNTSRIFVSIRTQDILSSILTIKASIIHEAIGILINLSFLIITYIIVEKFIIKYKDHAKLA